MEIQKICVVGGGLMGRQIALNTAIYGIKATVYDLNEAVCAAVEEWAEDYLAGRIAKGRMTEEQVAKTKELSANTINKHFALLIFRKEVLCLQRSL